MFENTDIHEQLKREQYKRKIAGDRLVEEANKILNQDLFTEKKILKHLGNTAVNPDFWTKKHWTAHVFSASRK